MKRLKAELINWLGSLENEKLLLKIHEQMQQLRRDDFQAHFPVMTLEEMRGKIEAGIEDGRNSRFISQEELDREVENW